MPLLELLEPQDTSRLPAATNPMHEDALFIGAYDAVHAPAFQHPTASPPGADVIGRSATRPASIASELALSFDLLARCLWVYPPPKPEPMTAPNQGRSCARYGGTGPQSPPHDQWPAWVSKLQPTPVQSLSSVQVSWGVWQ